MNTYLFIGLVHPERAQISLECPKTEIEHFTSGASLSVILSIKFNHVLAWIETETEWSLDDLRNVVKNYVSDELDLVGFIKGYAYDLDIRRVVNPVLNLDFTFGIDTPCIVSRNKEIELLTTYMRRSSIRT